jgi:YfiR/HmsC-like
MDLLTARRGLASLLILAATFGMAQLVLSQASAPPGTGSRGASLEYQVKAAYLLNFTRYVDWPSQVFQAPTDPVRVCVLGQDPFGVVLDATMQGKTTQGRPLAVRRVRSSSGAAGCHLVFISRKTWRTLRELPRALRSAGRLTVGESEEFAQAGGVIGFVIRDEAVRFVVNAEARDRAGLRISSRMLSLAAAVYGQEAGP